MKVATSIPETAWIRGIGIIMPDDVTRPGRQYGSCSHVQIQLWTPVVLVVEEIVKVRSI